MRFRAGGAAKFSTIVVAAYIRLIVHVIAVPHTVLP
jgi:hypothetical protein